MKICAHSLALAITEKSLNTFLKWHHNQSLLPNFTALSEYGKSKTAGKKPLQQGVTKKQTQQIKDVVQQAEESNMEWQRRGLVSSSHGH